MTLSLNTRAVAALVAAAVLAMPAPATAQPFTIVLGDSARLVTRPGQRVAIPVALVRSTAGTGALASLAARVRWDVNQLQWDSVRTNTLAGVDLDVNPQQGAGELSISAYSTTNLAQSWTMLTMHFTAREQVGGQVMSVIPMVAADENGTSALDKVRTRSLGVCNSPDGALWGDVNTDGAVNVIDAQQIARYSIGLTVLNPQGIASRGDVNADGSVNVIDAQQIARYGVRLSAASRIAQPLFQTPPVASLVPVPGSLWFRGVGEQQPLFAEPRDSTSASLGGCVPVTYVSRNSAVASVAADGMVTAVTNGTTAIVATAGGVSRELSVAVGAPSPTVAPATLVTGEGFSCGLAADGAAYCWGDNTYSQLGDGTAVRQRTLPQPVATGVRFRSLAVGEYHVCGIERDGSVWCWGYHNAGNFLTSRYPYQPNVRVPQRIELPAPSVQLALGIYHNCALLSNAQAWCWGTNQGVGMLGRGSLDGPGTDPAPVAGGVSFQSLSAAGRQTCGVSLERTVFCWGANEAGQLGRGTLENSGTPAPVAGDGRYQSVAVGRNHTCALRLDGQAQCWGLGAAWALGNGTDVTRTTPTDVAGGITFRALAAGYNSACGITVSSDVMCWGQVFGVGPLNVPAPMNGLASIVQLSLAYYHVCALRLSGEAACRGANSAGQLGNGSTVDRTTPVAVALPITVAQAAVGRDAGSCAVAADGAAYCWGRNTNGQVGTGAAGEALAAPARVESTVALRQIVQGVQHSCALDGDGVAYCWGSNTRGQLGVGDTAQRVTPTRVSGTLRFTQLQAGAFFTCGMTTTAQIACWGRNADGELGAGVGQDRSVPALNDTLTASSVALGAYHGCALKADGQVFCWGKNEAGQLGTGAAGTPALTTAVSGTVRFTQLSLGTVHSCGVGTDAAIYCWGAAGVRGRLGTGSMEDRSVPTRVSSTATFRQVSAATDHSCGVTAQDVLYCWGANQSGQLGDGSSTDRGVPTLESAGLTVARVAAGGGFTAGTGHTCALLTDGSLRCWGNNASGQVGDATRDTRLLATPVVWPPFRFATEFAASALQLLR